MSRRTIALVAAIVLAAVATVALISYVQGRGNKKASQGTLVTVFVAKDVIPQGTSGDTAISQGLINTIKVPLLARVDGAIGSLQEIKGEVASVDIQKNEQILTSRFVAPGTAGNTLAIPTGFEAVSVQVAIPPGVAGFIKTNDSVSVIAQVAVPKTGALAAATTPTVKYLLQNVKVLAVGQFTVTTAANGSTTSTTQQTAGQVLLTLAVTPVQAEKLVLANLQGQLYFALLPAQPGKPANTPGRTTSNEFSK